MKDLPLEFISKNFWLSDEDLHVRYSIVMLFLPFSRLLSIVKQINKILGFHDNSIL